MKAHWPGLDGLRGVAVLAVIAFHASLGFAANGYIGVDIFFALSGFLITHLLLTEQEKTENIALGAFYARRVLRLYPALFVTCIGVLGLGVLGHRLGVLLPASIAAVLYAANWWLYLGHEMSLLDHTWTLAIEEHFYVLWPVGLWLALSASRRRRLLAGVMLGVFLVVLIAQWPAEIAAVKSSYLRGAPIVGGCVVALALHRPAIRHRLTPLATPLGVAGALLTIALTIVPTALPLIPLQGLTSVPGLASLAVIIAVVLAPKSFGVRWLTITWLRWCGRRAYGLYLYHFPILLLAIHQVDQPASPAVRALLGVMLTFGLAAASYTWLEMPFLRLKRHFEPKTSA